MKKEKIENILIPLILIAVPLILYGKVLFSGTMLFGTDWLGGAYMKREFIVNSLKHFNIFPLWNPNFFAGIPTGEGFLGDIFYPLTFILKLILPLYVVWTLSFIIHPFFAGLGTYLFIKNKFNNKYIALFGGLAYMMTGVILSETYAGHDGRVMVACFLPILLYFLDRAFLTKKLYYYLFGAIVSSFMLLSGHVQSSYYAIFAGLFYISFNHINIHYTHKWRNYTLPASLLIGFIFSFVHRYLGFGIFLISVIAIPPILDRRFNRESINIYGSLILYALFTAILSAVQYIPLMRYIPFTARGASRGYAYATSWAMGVTEIMDMFFPGISGINIGDVNNYWGVNPFKLHLRYIGIIPVFLGIGAMLRTKKSSFNMFFTGAFITSMVIAIGSATPLYHIFYNTLPYFDKFRAPELIFFVAAFSVIVLAAEMISKRDNDRTMLIFGSVIFSFGLLIFLFPQLFINIFQSAVKSFPISQQMIQQKLMIVGSAVNGIRLTALISAALTAFTFLFLYKSRFKRTDIVIGALIVLTVIDIGGRTQKYIQAVDAPDKYFKKDAVVTVLEKEKGLFRVFPLSYRNDNYLSLFNINSIQNNHPSPFGDYQKFIGNENSVMFSPMTLLESPNRLAMLNVMYMIAPQIPVDTAGYDIQSKQVIMQYNSLFDYLGFIRYKDAGNYMILKSKNVLPRIYAVNKFVLAEELNDALVMIDKNISLNKQVILYKDPGINVSNDSLNYEISDIIYTPNKVTFNISINQNGFVIILDQYYKAWKSEVNGEQREILKANGMFRAIPVQAGANSVTMYYDNTLQKMALIISLLGVLLIIIIFILEKFRSKIFRKQDNDI